MAAPPAHSEWTGLRGRLFAWYLQSPLRRLSEVLVFGDVRTPFLREVLSGLRRGEIMLDVGAGSGYFSLPLADKLTGGKVICLDLSPEMLAELERKARQRNLLERVQTLRGSAYSLDLPDSSVDLAFSCNVFHELPHPETALREMVRVLRPGGKIVITDFRPTWLSRRVASHGQECHGPFTVAELEELLGRFSLQDIRVLPLKHMAMGRGNKK